MRKWVRLIGLIIGCMVGTMVGTFLMTLIGTIFVSCIWGFSEIIFFLAIGASCTAPAGGMLALGYEVQNRKFWYIFSGILYTIGIILLFKSIPQRYFEIILFLSVSGLVGGILCGQVMKDLVLTKS
jgi:integral membrane sensor domain MASE1